MASVPSVPVTPSPGSAAKALPELPPDEEIVSIDIQEGTGGACEQRFGDQDKEHKSWFAQLSCLGGRLAMYLYKGFCIMGSWTKSLLLTFHCFSIPVQDAPSHVQMIVVSAKGDDKTLCLRCYYIKRGSFAKLQMREFLTVLRTIPALKQKLPGICCVPN